MAYDLPERGDPNWDTKLNASIEAVKETAEAAPETVAADIEGGSGPVATALTASIDQQTRPPNLRNPITGWVHVTAFGAVGDGTANDTAAIDAALGALNPGDTLYFPPGRYMTDGGHIVDTPSVKIVGPSGRAQTYNSSAQLYLRPAADADMLTITATQVTVRDLSLFGDYLDQTGTSRGIVIPNTAVANYFLFDGVWVDSFNGNGYDLDSSGGTLSGTISNCESRLNRGFGMYFRAGSTDTIVTNCYVDQNTQSGVFIAAGDISLTSCHIWGNGTAGSGDRDGITLQSASFCRIVNCYVEGQHAGAGIKFKSGTLRGHIVKACDVWDNGGQGIYLFGVTNSVISGNIVRTNNYSQASDANGAGIVVDGSCSGVAIVGNSMFSQSANRQTYGYYELGTSNTGIRFSDNSSRATDHSTGGVFLGPGTLADLGEVFKSKAADSSVTSSTTRAADTDLQFTAAVGEVWEIEGTLFVEGDQATGDFACEIAGPSGTTGYWSGLGPAVSGTSATAASMVPVAVAPGTGMSFGCLTSNVIAVRLTGLITITTAGTVSVKWAQNASSATATTVKAGSFLRARRRAA